MASRKPRVLLLQVSRGTLTAFEINVEPEKFLEHCARVVARASGFEYRGRNILVAAADNPRAAEYVRIARAVLREVGIEVPNLKSS